MEYAKLREASRVVDLFDAAGEQVVRGGDGGHRKFAEWQRRVLRGMPPHKRRPLLVFVSFATRFLWTARVVFIACLMSEEKV